MRRRFKIFGRPEIAVLSLPTDIPTKKKVIGGRLQSSDETASSADNPKKPLLSVLSGSGSKRQKRS